MKKLLLTLFVAVLVFAEPAISKENSKERAPVATVGVVNILKIQSEAKVYKSIRKQLGEYKEKFKKESSKKEKELKKLNNEIIAQKSLISPEQFKKRVDELKEKFKKDRIEVTRKIENLDKAFLSVMQKVKIKALAPAINKVAKEKGINIVLNNAEIIFYAPTMDMTDGVLKILDETMPKVAFPNPDKMKNKK